MKSVILRLILILSLISNIATSGLQAQGPDAGAKALFVKTKDRKSTRLNSSHSQISYAVFCLKKKNKTLARSFAMPDSNGALLGIVEMYSPAAKAGFKSGDVIRKIDGVAMTESTHVTASITNS